jgi:choline kinase
MGNNLLHASLVLPTYNAVDSGIYYLQNSIFPFIEKCFAEGKKSLPMVITELAIQGKFKVHNIENDEVVDIDREKDIQYISEIFLSNSKENKNA